MSDVHVTEQAEAPERPDAEVFDITTKRPTAPEPAEASVPAPPVETDDEEESQRLRPVPGRWGAW
ncbi:hypothetical protein JHN50_32825, partial [Streptomyces sp. MBT98]|uniref:hypothetical protein n=1 Tax=Streptomyces sp. MBT98 TaxID=2800412 RepID=UPI00190C9330